MNINHWRLTWQRSSSTVSSSQRLCSDMHCTSRRQRGHVKRWSGGEAYLQNFHVELVSDSRYLPRNCDVEWLSKRRQASWAVESPAVAASRCRFEGLNSALVMPACCVTSRRGYTLYKDRIYLKSIKSRGVQSHSNLHLPFFAFSVCSQLRNALFK